MELLQLIRVERVLEKYAQDAQKIYAEQIAQGEHNASGELAKTAKATVIRGNTAYEVTLDLAFYWKFLEGGSKGAVTSPLGAVYKAHFPPISALEQWIEIKPVIPRPDSGGKIPTTKQLAYLIGRKIWREGIEPDPIIANTIPLLNAKYEPLIADALGADVGPVIETLFKGVPESVG